MEETRLLMVVNEAEARDAYRQALDRVGVSYHTAASFREMLHMSIDAAYSGLLIDLLTLVRSSQEEKSIAYDCINLYPTLRVKWDTRLKCMSLSPLEQSFSSNVEAGLSYFIESRCKPFAARSLRRFNRKDCYLSVLIFASDGPDAEAVKSFTVNISQGGAFVHTTRPLPKGAPVRLSFAEQAGEAPIMAVVCWNIEWGSCRSIPGTGVMFDGLTERQANWINIIAPST
ncbi:MAG TPA: PilZ domain-containing protein [Geobacter sp.]|nr:PilZ domain-containing protein [Geobacter sp.]